MKKNIFLHISKVYYKKSKTSLCIFSSLSFLVLHLSSLVHFSSHKTSSLSYSHNFFNSIFSVSMIIFACIVFIYICLFYITKPSNILVSFIYNLKVNFPQQINILKNSIFSKCFLPISYQNILFNMSVLWLLVNECYSLRTNWRKKSVRRKLSPSFIIAWA